jgi:hypothetical protein
MTQEVTLYEEREPTWEEQVAHILGELTTGRSVSAILREDEGMPTPRAFWMRLYRDDELYEKISRARTFGSDACIEHAIEAATTPMEGQEVTVEVGPDGVKRRVVTKDMLGHRRLVVETWIKRAQMIAPRKYGPKLDVTSDGEKISTIADAIRAGNERLAKEGRGSE